VVFFACLGTTNPPFASETDRLFVDPAASIFSFSAAFRSAIQRTASRRRPSHVTHSVAVQVGRPHHQRCVPQARRSGGGSGRSGVAARTVRTVRRRPVRRCGGVRSPPRVAARCWHGLLAAGSLSCQSAGDVMIDVILSPATVLIDRAAFFSELRT
jgi:hypothetical protein